MRKCITISMVMAFLFSHPILTLAEDWREKYPKVTFGICWLGKQKDKIAQARHIVDYLSEQTGVKVVLRTASDYASIIEDMSAGQVEFMESGAIPYATAYDAMQGNLEPLALTVSKKGQRGYHIVMAVKGDSPYNSLDDLRGKTMACPDPNSTSCYLLPKSYLDPDRPFFSKTSISGSHEKSIIGVVNDTYDCAVTWAFSKDLSNITGMIKDGLIKEGNVKTIWWSSLVPNHCVSVVKSLPKEMKLTFKKALIDFAKNDPKRLQQYDPKISAFTETDHEDYKIALKIMETKKKARDLYVKSK